MSASDLRSSRFGGWQGRAMSSALRTTPKHRRKAARGPWIIFPDLFRLAERSRKCNGRAVSPRRRKPISKKGIFPPCTLVDPNLATSRCSARLAPNVVGIPPKCRLAERRRKAARGPWIIFPDLFRLAETSRKSNGRRCERSIRRRLHFRHLSAWRNKSG